MNYRKGITPVIAVVLLLLLTIGAVVTAGGLIQDVIGNPDEQLQKLDKAQRAKDTSLKVDTAFRQKHGSGEADTMNLTIRNVGSRAVNLSTEVEIRYRPDSYDNAVDYSSLARVNPELVETAYENCLDDVTGTESNQLIDPEETVSCDTGVKFPNPASSVEILFIYESTGDKVGSYSCSPSTSSTPVC